MRRFIHSMYWMQGFMEATSCVAISTFLTDALQRLFSDRTKNFIPVIKIVCDLAFFIGVSRHVIAFLQ